MLFNQGATFDFSLPFLSRLGTRTKEYNMWARVKVINKLILIMKVRNEGRKDKTWHS